MDVQAVICSQYYAAMGMLQQAVERCPDELWDSAVDANPFWRVSYHAVFFTHLYLHKSLGGFKAWDRHWGDAESLDSPILGPRYTRADVLEFLELCRGQVVAQTTDLDWEGLFFSAAHGYIVVESTGSLQR